MTMDCSKSILSRAINLNIVSLLHILRGEETEQNLFYHNGDLRRKKLTSEYYQLSSAGWGTYNSLLERGGERYEINDIKTVNQVIKNATKKQLKYTDIDLDKHEYIILYLKLEDGLTTNFILTDNGYLCPDDVYTGYKINPLIFKKLWNQL